MHRCTSILIYFLLLFGSITATEKLDARLKYSVEGNGFHRNIQYRIDIKNISSNDCHVAIYLELPAALYVNVDEIAEHRRLGSNTVCSEGETNVELFMENAEPQNVTVCARLESDVSVLRLPIHQRYLHSRENGGYANVTLPRPRLLLGCKDRIKAYRVSKINLCSPCAELSVKWREIPYVMDAEDYVWLIPVGDSSLRPLIACTTLLATIIGAAIIIRKVWDTNVNRHTKED